MVLPVMNCWVADGYLFRLLRTSRIPGPLCGLVLLLFYRKEVKGNKLLRKQTIMSRSCNDFS